MKTTQQTQTQPQHTLPPPHVIVMQQPQAPQRTWRRQLAISAIIHLVFNPVTIIGSIPVVCSYVLWAYGKKVEDGPKPQLPPVVAARLPDPEAEKPPVEVIGHPVRDKPKASFGGQVGGIVGDAKRDVIDTIEGRRKKKEADELAAATKEAQGMGIPVEDWWDSSRVKEEIQKFKEAPEREALTDELARYRYGVSPTLPMADLRKQLAMVRDFMNAQPAYQLKMRQWEHAVEQWKWSRDHGDNSMCPRCRNTFRTRTESKHSLKCRCGWTTSAGNFRSFFKLPPPPREPEPPVMSKGFIGWLLG